MTKEYAGMWKRQQGYKAVVCYGGEEATKELEEYLKGTRTKLGNREGRVEI